MVFRKPLIRFIALESTILEQKLVDHAIANCVIEDVENNI